MSGIVLAAVLPGCGGGASDSGTGPHREVEIVPPKDAQGKSYPISGEGNLPAAPKK